MLDSGNPAEALRIAGQHSGPLPLMITDVMMPCHSGPDLAKKLSEFRPQTIVLYTRDAPTTQFSSAPCLGRTFIFLKTLHPRRSGTEGSRSSRFTHGIACRSLTTKSASIQLFLHVIEQEPKDSCGGSRPSAQLRLSACGRRDFFRDGCQTKYRLRSLELINDPG